MLPGREAAYQAWFSLNYNLAQTRRMLRSDDPVYLGTASIRMAVYGHPDLWFGYFTIRQILWQGDKDAFRYLQREAPDFLGAFQRFINATELHEKLKWYEKAAALAAEPLGGLWGETICLTNLEQNLIWAELIKGE